MADLVRPFGVGMQIRLIARLRWRIMRNGLLRQDSKWDLIGMIFAGFFAALLVLALSVAIGAGAYAFLSQGRANWLALLFWAIFLFWQAFPIFVTGFGQQFEFRGLLRFPLSVGAFFVISLAYGLADFSAAASLCWLLAMTIGVTVARPDLLPAMIVISGIFALANVTLERLTGSWLERLLAQRRTRELVFGLFILLMVIVQLTASSVASWGKAAAPWLLRIIPVFAVFPPGMAGWALKSAADDGYGKTFLYATGIGGYALIFGALLWKRLAAQFRGEELSETAAPSSPRTAMLAVKQPEESNHLRWLSPQVEAVVRKEFRYLTRNGFLLLSLVMPPVLVILFGSQMELVAKKYPMVSSGRAGSELIFPGLLAYLLLILVAPAYNCFAYEGRGMQTLFTAPVRFRDVFVGKNLMLLAVITFELLLSVGILALRIGLPSLPMLAATMAALLFSVAGQIIIANWSSLNFPRKLEFGSMRNQRASGMAVLLAFGTQIVVAGACSVVFLSGRWFGSPWLPAGVFAVLAASALGGYFSSLDALSELAEKRREVLLNALCK